MKTASPALTALILSGQFVDFNCYTYTLPNGTVLRYTAADFDVTDGTNKWDSSSVLVDDPGNRPKAHWKVGLDVDTWSTTIVPRVRNPISGAAFPDVISGVPFLAAAAGGFLDGATVLVQRAYYPVPPANPIPAAGALATGFLTVFFGMVGEVNPSSSRVDVQVQDMRQLLTVQMPRLVYQASCWHKLFDSRCTLTAATYAKTGTVAANSTTGVIKSSVPAPSGSGTFTFGRIKFTSGANTGVSRSIRAWDGASTMNLFTPLPFLPAVGDAFAAYPGCDKTMATCTLFSNLVNFGGTPFTPVPEVTA